MCLCLPPMLGSLDSINLAALMGRSCVESSMIVITMYLTKFSFLCAGLSSPSWAALTASTWLR
jgi:hypothetical protein